MKMKHIIFYMVLIFCASIQAMHQDIIRKQEVTFVDRLHRFIDQRYESARNITELSVIRSQLVKTIKQIDTMQSIAGYSNVAMLKKMMPGGVEDPYGKIGRMNPQEIVDLKNMLFGYIKEGYTERFANLKKDDSQNSNSVAVPYIHRASKKVEIEPGDRIRFIARASEDFIKPIPVRGKAFEIKE